MADVSDIVRVNTRLATSGAARREFGRTLFVYRSSDLTTALSAITEAQLIERARELNKVPVFPNQSAVDAAFDENDDPYKAGAIYFQQIPFPRNLLTAAWYESGADTYIWGGEITTRQQITDVALSLDGVDLGITTPATAVNNGSGYGANITSITVDDASVFAVGDVVRSGSELMHITAINANALTVTRDFGGTGAIALSDDDPVTLDWGSNLAKLATAIETAVRALDGYSASVEVDVQQAAARSGVGRFIMKIPVDDISLTVPVFTGNTAGLIGLDGDGSPAAGQGGAVHYPGLGVETFTNSLDRIVGLDDSAYWLTLDPALEESEIEALAAASWINARDSGFLLLGSSDVDVFIPGETDSIPARLRALEYDRVAVLWSAKQDYKAVSLAARFSSVDFGAAATQLTAKFKTLPGTAADSLTTAQENELDRKRVNYYVPVRGTSIIASDGTTLGSGKRYIDTRYFVDWMVDAIETDVLNLFITSGLLPNTTDGVAAIRNVISAVCEQGVQNGGIAPGTASEAMSAEIRQVTGNRNFDGALNNGYLVHASNPAALSQSERDARTTVAFNVWVKLSGAIHAINVNLVFEA